MRTVTGDGVPWTPVGEPIPTGRAPSDIAVLNDGGTIEIFVTLPLEGALQEITVGDGSVTVPLGDGAVPTDVAVDPQGDSIIVGDAALGVVHVIRHDDLSHIDRDLDVGGPTSRVTTGVVDIGDGLAPVALALRTDKPVAVAIKLFRDGFREPRYSVLGSAGLPSFPMTAYVPDERTSVTVCCNELTVEAVNAGEASDAWAAVGMASGKVLYLRLVPPVRPFDNDLEPLALGNAPTWTPAGDDEARIPSATLTPADNFGSPPFVPLLDADETLTLIWEGSPPGLSSLSGTLSFPTFTATRDLTDLDAHVGDVAALTVESPPAGCDTTFQGTASAIDGDAVTIDGLTPDQATCIAGGGTVRLAVGALDAFVVFDRDNDYLGRLDFTGDVALPGATLSLTASDAGPPQHRGSTLSLPLDPHVSLLDLDLSDPSTTVSLGGGGFGTAGLQPVAIAGGQMTIPSPSNVAGETIVARRMVIATASPDSLGLNAVYSCDEGETIPAFCGAFQ